MQFLYKEPVLSNPKAYPGHAKTPKMEFFEAKWLKPVKHCEKALHLSLLNVSVALI